MQVRKKIILSFFVVIGLIWLIGIILINISENKIKDYIKEDLYYSVSYISRFVKSEMDLEILDLVVKSQEFALQQLVQEENKKLANMKNPREYIKEKDYWWVNFPSNKTDKFIDEIVNSDKSKKILCGELCLYECGSATCLNVILTDSLGGLLLASIRPEKYDYYQETWWNKAKENGVYVNDCLYDENLKKYLMEISVSVKDDKENFLGVQRVNIDLEYVLKLFFDYITKNLQHSHYDTKYTIIDTTGKVFFSESGYSFLDKYRDVEAINLKLNDDKKNIELTDKNGKEKVIFFNSIHGEGDNKNYIWIIIAEHDQDLIYADINIVPNNILLFCIFITIICMILAFVFTNKVLSPIQLLHDEIQKIKKNELTGKIGININDDLSELGKTFNELFEKIVDYQEQISFQKTEMTQIFNSLKDEIQEKVKNKELFLEEKEKLIATLKSIQDAIITVDTDGVITMMNGCAENLTGVTFKNDEKMHIDSVFFIQENRIRSFKDIFKFLNSPEHNNYLSEKVTLISSNGTRYFIYNYISAIINSQNLMIGVMFVFRDIGGLSTIEKEILESENRYRNLVNNAHIGIFRSNIDGKLISINPAFVNILQGESTEKVLSEITDVRKQLYYSPIEKLNVFKELEEGIGSLFFEQRLFTLTGKLIIVSFSLNLIRDKFGNPEFIDGFMEDITERKSAEENFYKLFNNNPEYMVISTFDTGVILNVNKSYTDMFGFSYEDLVGKSAKKLELWVNDDDRERIINSVNDNGTVRNVELKFNTKFGKEIICLTSFDKILYSGVTCLLCIGRDISERKDWEDVFTNEKERLATTLKFILDGVIATDNTGKIIMFNKNAELITGWVDETAIGKDINEILSIFDINDEKKKVDILQKINTTNTTSDQELEYILISKDGTKKIITYKGTVIRDRNDQHIGIVNIFRDITKKKSLEEEIQKSQKIKSIGILAGGFANTFNNTLTNIMGSISLALIKSDANSKDHYLKIAKESAIRAKGVIQQLLTFAKGGNPVKKLISLEEIIKSCNHFNIDDSKIKLEFDIEPNLWQVEIDESQFSQVLYNITTNAIQALSECGKIIYRAKNYVSSGKDNLPVGKFVSIQIIDNGHGISEETIGKIFDPYFTTKEDGSGIGLSVVLSIVQKHGGFISVESELGEGTTFTIFLPVPNIIPVKDVSKVVEYKSDEKLNKSILVMDDEESVRTLILDMLTTFGYDVDSAVNGDETLAKYKESMLKGKPFDGVIIDINIFGGMGGKETIEKLLIINPNVKAVASSGYSNDSIMTDPKKYGFKSALVKPYLIDEVKQVVAAVLNEKDGNI